MVEISTFQPIAVIWASSSADWRALTSQPKEIDCKAYSQQRENLTPSQKE